MKSTPFPKIEDVERLLSLQHGDRGFFVLALYSFIEGYLRNRYSLSYDDAKFSDLHSRIVSEIKHSRYVEDEEYQCLRALSRDIFNANKVRHNYDQISVEEVRASIYLFTRFAKTVGFYEVGQLFLLDQNLDDWNSRKSAREMYHELEVASSKITELTRANANLGAQINKLENLRTTLAHLEFENTKITLDNAGLRKSNDNREKKNQDLRQKNFDESVRVRKEITELQAKISELADAQNYLDALSRITVYTRTRLDFERSLIRLTGEQAKILDQINLQKDFLVKGSAGTGKSLVLVKALEKAIIHQKERLGLEDLESFILLTYTKSLVAYTRYVSSLLKIEDPRDLICTVDKFMLARFRTLVAEGNVTYRLDDVLSSFCPLADLGLSARDLYNEAENFIWANMVTESEYVTAVIGRTGMKKPIREEFRKAVWDSVELAAQTLRKANTWTRSLVALHVALNAEANPNIERVDYVFIDEVQDLSAVILAAIKACTRRSVVLAGDSDQAIYQNGFSWKRAGIDIAGRSRILGTNFRNTIQLHDFAERYRKTIPGMDGENKSDAFRYGMLPEHSSGKTVGELYDKLLQKMQLCLTYLAYDAENICIIAPTNDHLNVIAKQLKDFFDLPSAIIKDDSFQFDDKGVIRLSTMHSSKGLDFPVVLFVLDHRPHGLGPYDDETIDRMTRNLIYVSITRAMEQLHIFTLETATAPAIVDLVAALPANA